MRAPSPYSFTFEPLFLVAVLAAGLLYLRARRQGFDGTARQALVFGTGLFLIAAALNSPLETIAVEYLLLAHLFQNVIIADWAPPLLILGLTPAMRAAVAGRGGRVFATLTRPTIALPIWVVGWYVIHLAAFYEVALRNQWLLNVEHAALIAIGLLFWWPVLADAPHAVATPIRLAYLGTGFVLASFLGLALTFASSPLYAYYTEAPRLWGLSAEQDQSFGGILMNSEQAAIYLVAICYFLLRLFREEDAKEIELTKRQAREGLNGGE